MKSVNNHQLKHYIALAAPATRAPAERTDAFMRSEIGFTPAWFRTYCGIDFSRRWHEDPDHRLQAYAVMREEIRRRFPGRDIGGVLREGPPDLLSGTFGAVVVPVLFGQEIRYAPDQWPVAHGQPLTDAEADALTQPDLENAPFFQGILDQIDRIKQLTGTARGFLNWQGVLNVAFRLRGEQIFMDLCDAPERAHHVFDCVTHTIIQGIKMLYDRQSKAGVRYRFATIGNCVVNMIRPEHYQEHVFPYDLKIRAEFEDFAIHNCAWVLNPYMDCYATVPDVGYIDMGLESDLSKAKRLFPGARRNVLYTPMDLASKSEAEIRVDFERIATELAPCDVGMPDLDLNIPDERVVFVMDLCEEMSCKYGNLGK